MLEFNSLHTEMIGISGIQMEILCLLNSLSKTEISLKKNKLTLKI